MTLSSKGISKYQKLFKDSEEIIDIENHKIEIGNIYFYGSIITIDKVFPISANIVYHIHDKFVFYYSYNKEVDNYEHVSDLDTAYDVFIRWIKNNKNYIKFAKLNLITL